MNKVNNPSVSYADSSLYTREPLMLASKSCSLYRMISLNAVHSIAAKLTLRSAISGDCVEFY